MLLEKSQTEVLSLGNGGILLLSQKARQVMLLVLLESGQVEPPDLAAGDLEELAQYSIADVGGVVETRHQLAELELDKIVHLLLRELLHRYRF